MARLKICGNMEEPHVKMCVEHGVSIIGFVTEYPQPVPWNISLEQTVKLRNMVSGTAETAVVTGGDPDHTIHIARTVMPDYIQVHGEETLEEVRYIVRALADYPVKVIKALQIDPEGICKFEQPELELAVPALQETGIDYLLTDAATKELPGGTGVTLDLSVYQRVKELLQIPMIIAGGITEQNVQQLIQELDPYAVDILTGIETAHGEKSANKLTSITEKMK